MNIMFALVTLGTFLITVVLARVLIPVLKSIKMGQKILDIGPRWHKSKDGTPTMGGIFFICATLPFVLGFCIWKCDYVFLIHYVFVLLNGLIGLADDYTKFVKKQNKGLSAKQKLVFQFLVAAAYLLSLHLAGQISTQIALPFTTLSVDLKGFYYAIMLVAIVFTVNSTNLTDGIDGLCSSITAVCAICFAVLGIKSENDAVVILSACLLGGMIGFLVYNFHPAKVFMGDTGSLYIGGAVCALAIMLDVPFILLFFGIMYYVESVSVMIQVVSYKLTGKRVFKMTPIHHHFEMCGWNEVKIVFVFSLITAVFAFAGCFAFINAL